MRTEDTKQPSASEQGGVEHAGPEVEAIAERLGAIIHACGGHAVESDDADLWFRVESGDDLQVRLNADRAGRCYDRSANFAISYGGQPSNAPVSSQFRTVVERIKAVDALTLAGIATAFRPAARAVVRSLSSGEGEEPRTAAVEPTSGALGSESPLGRALNVIFLDLCLRLAGEVTEALRPLHWGFWPTTSVASAQTLKAPDDSRGAGHDDSRLVGEQRPQSAVLRRHGRAGAEGAVHDLPAPARDGRVLTATRGSLARRR